MSRLDYSKSIAYFRDSFVPFSDAKVSIASSPVLYGLSIYTVFSLSWNPKDKKLYVYRLEDHWKRLVSSAKIMDFHSFITEWDYKKFEKIIFELIDKNNIKEDALVRVSVFIDALLAGTKIHGLQNSLSAYVYPLGEILPRAGIDVCVSSFRRTPDNSIPSRAKVNGGYTNVALMKNEAILNGYHDAIALNDRGYVTEGTVANIFFVRDNTLITPPIGFDILEGITRDSIIKIAHEMKIKVVERPVLRSELYIFDEAFMCGSSARITPVLSIDKRKVGNGKVGKITSDLIQKYEQILQGKVKGYEKWVKKV